MRVKNIDFLGSIFGFTYDDSVRYKTTCGGILSLILIFLTLCVILAMGISFWDKSTPFIVQENIFTVNPPAIRFQNKFQIAVRIVSGHDIIYQNMDKIRIKLVETIMFQSDYNNVTENEIQMKECTKADFPYHSDLFEKYQLDKSLCPDLNSRFVSGDFISEYFYYFQVKFYICRNDPITGISNDGSNVTCKSEEEIKDYLSANVIKAHVFYTDSNYDGINYTDPDVHFINNYNINIYFSTKRETHMFLHYSNMTSDDTVLFFAPSVRKFVNIAFSDVSERAAVRETHMNDLVLIYIRSKKSGLSLTRSYKGFADLAANAGGIVNLFVVLFNCWVFLYSRVEFFNRLIKDSLYIYHPKGTITIPNKYLTSKPNVKNPEEVNLNIIKFSEDSKKIVPSQINDSSFIEGKQFNGIKVKSALIDFNYCGEKIGNVNQLLIKENLGKLSNRINELNIVNYDHEKSFFEKVVISFCPLFTICSKKIRRDIHIMEYSLKYYFKHTDFFVLYDSLIEMKLLKKFILSKEETDVLDVMKRLIYVKDNQMILSLKDKDLKTTKSFLKSNANSSKFERILKSYLNKSSNEGNKSNFEKNILQHFDQLYKI
jgi:hypothetical protein